jgi:hypothetical protein
VDTKRQFEFLSWSQLEDKISELRAAHDAPGRRRSVVFRGQGSDRWRLDTTLERRAVGKCTWGEYASLVRATMPAVQSLTGRDWLAPSQEELREWGKDYEQAFAAPPGYDYYVYLRHHGFPSPLLDWSRSLYVAAFFAFRAPSADRVAIFAYLDNLAGSKVGSSARSRIMQFGPYVKSHPRHVLQQCEYTMCSVWENDHWAFASHEDVFGYEEPEQDLLWKFTLPTSERLQVLRRLDEANLNAYSLFPTEDTLLETVALREIEFRDRLGAQGTKPTTKPPGA